MNLKEYEAQLALGTVDFRVVANETKSSTVLQDIIGRTDDVVVLSAVATNPKSNIYTLTLLATFPSAEESIVVSCAYHPNVSMNVLERWMKYPAIKNIQAVQQRFRTLQLAFGVSADDAWVVEIVDRAELLNSYGRWQKDASDDATIYPNTLREYVIWTTTGNNVSIELDDNRFKFTDDPGDSPIYYSYDAGISSAPISMKWSGGNEA